MLAGIDLFHVEIVTFPMWTLRKQDGMIRYLLERDTIPMRDWVPF